MLPSSTQFMQTSERFQTFRPTSIQVLESRETAEQILLASLRKLDKGKRSRTGLELKRGLMIAFTLFKARQILWQYPTPQPPPLTLPPPVQIPPPQPIYLASEDYTSTPNNNSMLSTLEKDINSHFWEPPRGEPSDFDDGESSGSEDSDSDDININDQDPFDEFPPGEPIFPPPFPIIFPEDDFLSPPNIYNPNSGLTNLTTVVPGSESHRNFEQNHPTVVTHLSNPISICNSRKRPYCSADSPDCLHVSPLKRSTSVIF
ncbi:unnamed protein product [Hymenolepis diminuta]|uniref:Reverse transcriptase domain-containing protein n=1 Tax=Hymenolepis diminuta TaxID=6216 RepID=A0A0R3SVD6_HYMDI|nr:unnamed protein product [Hymenolepis diminuta]VUZ51976.1 unnamed protein product [Hymenolepis diminuta]